MSKTAASFFVFLYLIAMLRPIQPYVEYVLNQDYIAEFLCINKEKPELQCNGKCHLVKQLEEQQKSNPMTPLRVSLENYPIGFVNIFKLSSFQSFINSTKDKSFFYQKLYHFNYNYSISRFSWTLCWNVWRYCDCIHQYKNWWQMVKGKTNNFSYFLFFRSNCNLHDYRCFFRLFWLGCCY